MRQLLNAFKRLLKQKRLGKKGHVMSSIKYEKDASNIVTLLMDAENSSANMMNSVFMNDLSKVATRLKSEVNLKGVILASAKKTFFAGGDLRYLSSITEENVAQFHHAIETMKGHMRTIETLGVPVVAALNGAALGGGWEMALVAHHRVSLNNEKIRYGLPESTLGLLAGAGGVTKMVRLLGLEAALPFLIEGKKFTPKKAHSLGLVSELAETKEELMALARKFIENNPKSQQPYDVKGYKIPGGLPMHPKLAMKLVVAPAMLLKKTKGVYPAQEKVLACAVEGAQVDLDTALSIETRYLCELAKGQVAKNIIGTFWFQMNELKAGKSRPEGIERSKVEKVGVLGAGMMGAGIAYAAAKSGVLVALKDVSLEQAEKGRAYSEKILSKKVGRGQLSKEQMASTLEKITPTKDYEDLKGSDLIIEAVFEDRNLKATVTKEAEPFLADNGIFASNTSTLPITGLAKGAQKEENFIGLHFFSPVDKMQLVEIICGEKTSQKTLAKAFDFVLQIGKVPIVVRDSRGFFTSRVFGTFTNEGIAMLEEGQSPASIEQAALQAGMPVGPLAISDEVSLSLMTHIRSQTEKDLKKEGKEYQRHPADDVIDKMMQAARPGRAKGAGFYDYPKDGQKHLWQGITSLFPQKEAIPFTDMKERLLFIQAIETVRCLEEGVLTSTRDANIGSIFGIGFAAWTGGALSYINQYGVQKFAIRAIELKERYGARFTPPRLLMEKAETNAKFED